MSTGGKTKVNQQVVLAANVARIMSDLHRLAAANARIQSTDKRASGADAPMLVIRGK